MKKKSFLLSFLILFALLALVGCKKHPSGETLSKVTLNEVAHSIFYAPQYVAIQEGYFAEEGIDLNLVTGFGADKTMTAVLSGEADIGGNDLCLCRRSQRLRCQLCSADSACRQLSGGQRRGS